MKKYFGINSLEDIKNTIKNVNANNIIKEGHGKDGWCIDQITLFDKVMSWNKNTNNFICLKENETKFKRLNRQNFDISNINEIKNITDSNYSDYHCYRPMSKYSDINWKIYNLL
jgi:hypothetical protein